jgi:pimeloyl-ACP methyl ester carboxylesterase
VLDAANVADANVYGISMGGMIAQELALRHPARVRALVLGATTPGGPKQTLPETEVLDFLRRRPSLPAEEAVWASVPYLYSRATRQQHTARIGEDVVQRLRFPPTRDGYLAQAGAARWHDTSGRLGSIRAPTLVLHGTEDQIVPRVNGERLVESIPSARLELLEDAGHLYPTDAPEAAHTVLHFLLG